MRKRNTEIWKAGGSRLFLCKIVKNNNISCISQKNVVSLHAKLRAKAKKEQAGYEYEDKDR